jgi:predicted enzyme related to lactoylglutathione lyase
MSQTEAPHVCTRNGPRCPYLIPDYQYGDGEICWIEFPATDIKRCQKFYSAVFGWEFSKPPGMADCPNSEEPPYVMFSKPGTKLHGGILRVKEAEMIKPELDAEGKGQTTNRLTMKVEEVDAALKAIEAAGGSIIWFLSFSRSFSMSLT